MESLKLDGTTIRGLVKGRPVHCIVRSVPDGLVLPRGQYLLRVGESNPIYGQHISIESVFGPAGMEHVGIHFKMPPSALKDSPAAVATLVPTKPAYSAILKEVPGFRSVSFRDVASSKVDAPASKVDTAAAAKFAARAAKFAAPAAKFDAPAAKFDAPAAKFDAPAALKYAPASKVDAPAAKVDAPASRVGAPASKVDAPASKVDAPAIKFDFVAGQGLTARVIIAIRPIGQNCLVAQAGFSDLLDAVQQAGGVTLIVS